MKGNRSLKILILLVNFFVFSCSSIKIDETQKRFTLDDKGKDKYFLIDFINKNQHLLGKTPTLFISKKDDPNIMIRSDREFKGKLSLKRNDFTRIEVLSIEKSEQLYGTAGKNGVLYISDYGKPNL